MNYWLLIILLVIIGVLVVLLVGAVVALHQIADTFLGWLPRVRK